mmetsp:Transcript_305/g.809  ORF Transcript_305/g.809 Transcript_305/m.809 type:complete len:103 (-) Transcript_305:7-315(-)
MVVTFHYYDASDGGNSRMGAREVVFDEDCWPYVTTETWSASKVLGTNRDASTTEEDGSMTEEWSTTAETTDGISGSISSGFRWKCLVLFFCIWLHFSWNDRS